MSRELSEVEHEAIENLKPWEHGCSDEETEGFYAGARAGWRAAREQYDTERENWIGNQVLRNQVLTRLALWAREDWRSEGKPTLTKAAERRDELLSLVFELKKLRSALEHPEGITDEQIDAAVEMDQRFTSEIMGLSQPHIPIAERLEPARRRTRERFRAILEAALFPGEEPTGVGSDENDPSKPGGELGR